MRSTTATVCTLSSTIPLLQQWHLAFSRTFCYVLRILAPRWFLSREHEIAGVWDWNDVPQRRWSHSIAYAQAKRRHRCDAIAQMMRS